MNVLHTCLVLYFIIMPFLDFKLISFYTFNTSVRHGAMNIKMHYEEHMIHYRGLHNA